MALLFLQECLFELEAMMKFLNGLEAVHAHIASMPLCSAAHCMLLLLATVQSTMVDLG